MDEFKTKRFSVKKCGKKRIFDGCEKSELFVWIDDCNWWLDEKRL